MQIGLGVQVDATRNEMTEGAFQTTGNPLDVAIEGDGLPARRRGRTAGQRTVHRADSRRTSMYTRAGRPDDEHAGLPDDAVGRVRDRPQRGRDRRRNRNDLLAPGTEDTYLRDPARLDERVDRPGRLGRLHRQQRRIENLRAARRSPATSRWRRSPTKPASNVSAARCGRRPPTPARRSSARPTPSGFGATIGGELEMSNVDLATRDDEDDHRRARLPGQLARDHDRRQMLRNARLDALGRTTGGRAAGRPTSRKEVRATRRLRGARAGRRQTVAVPARG